MRSSSSTNPFESVDAFQHHSSYTRRYDDSIDAAEAAFEESVFSGEQSHNANYFATSDFPGFMQSQSQDSEPFDIRQRQSTATDLRSPSALDFRRTNTRLPQCWESDGNFPIKEIERIRKKTKKLRSLRGTLNGNGDDDDDDFVQDNDDDDGFSELPPDSFVAHPAIRRQPSKSRASSSLQPPPRPTPYHRIQPQPWSRHLPAAAATTIQSQATDSLDEILNASSTNQSQQQQVEDDASYSSSSSCSKEVSQCLQPHETRLQYSVLRDSKSSSSDDKASNFSSDFVNRDPSLIQASSSASSNEQSDTVETGANPFLQAAAELSASVSGSTSNVSGSQDKPSTSILQHHLPEPIIDNGNDDATMTQLHDLCGEAATPNDLAWRNALALLSMQPALAKVADSMNQWTPLHICCMGPFPAPSYMLHALLFVHVTAARLPDVGGRLPLHLVAATSADVDTMQILVDEYPESLVTRDEAGFTPLHLLLRNASVELTVERARVLLGLSIGTSSSTKMATENSIASSKRSHLLQRRRDHLNLQVDEVNGWMRRRKPVTVFHWPKVVDHEALFDTYPLDVQLALKKLSKWKRLQKDAPQDSEHVDPQQSIIDYGIPAAMPSPTTDQLPVHVFIRRAFFCRTSLVVETQKKRSEDGSEDDDDDEFSDQEVSTSPSAVRTSVPHPFDILRLMVAAYPEALLHRDSDGFTPLLLVMADPAYVPELSVIELLLGTRTAGAYENLPEWSEDLRLHRSSNRRYMNPAMIPMAGSGQLPLHLASEEYLSEDCIIFAIRDSYPGAVLVQDNYGRTPLHTALRSYRRIAVEPRVLAALYTDRVALIRDDYGRLPVELLFDAFQIAPMKQPHDCDDDGDVDASAIYKQFIITSLRELGRQTSSLQNSRLLDKLRKLPPWLRQDACSSSIVKSLLIQELAGRWTCAYILLDGLVLVGLITVFRVQMEQYIKALYTGVLLANWYTYAVYLAATVRLVLNVSSWVVHAKFGEFQHLCLFNLPTWIDTSAMFLAIVTSVLLYGSDPEEQLLALGTATTGLLWLSLLSYLATWFCGMAVFTGALRKIACFLVWPVIIVCALCIGFAQMFCTLLQLDCERAIGITTVCSVRDSYRVVYMLARGESLASNQSYETMSRDAVVLVMLFLLLAALFCVGLLLSLLTASTHLSFEQLSTIYFWEPKLAGHFSLKNFNSSPGSVDRDETFWDSFDVKLDRTWTLCMVNLFGDDKRKRKHWVTSSKNSWNIRSLLSSLFAVVLVPIWLVLGIFTFGLAWPMQVRVALFRPYHFGQKETTSLDQMAREVSGMRQEISHLKAMAFHCSDTTEQKVDNIADILHSMKED
ncbi:hypothetical protein MPSEU_001025100 [Mayamaea pseudoterrestris]|nr:hypothetical protein MPSEU_001025100 [Mayamaea pseudoterrestris]